MLGLNFLLKVKYLSHYWILISIYIFMLTFIEMVILWQCNAPSIRHRPSSCLRKGHRHTYRQTDTQINNITYRPVATVSHIIAVGHTNTQVHKQTDNQIGRHTDRHTVSQLCTQADIYYNIPFIPLRPSSCRSRRHRQTHTQTYRHTIKPYRPSAVVRRHVAVGVTHRQTDRQTL